MTGMTAIILRRLMQPTLVRRGMLAVVLAFLLVFMVLLGYTYWKNMRAVSRDTDLLRFGSAITASLQLFNTDAQARAALASTDVWHNLRRAEDRRFVGRVTFELLDERGGRVYASPALAHEALPTLGQPLSRIQWRGAAHWLYENQVDGQPNGEGTAPRRWTLRLAVPMRTDAAWVSWNSGVLLENLLIALPCVLLPLWLSVRSGLKPLHQLADRIARREPGDLSPLGVTARYRELTPLTRALEDLLARLRHKVDRERAFVQDAAHELRTPLAVVAAQAHVMAHAEAGERAQAHALLQQAIARASHLAQQLLVLASLDDAQRAAPRAIDVAQVVRQLMAQAAPTALARGMDLSLDAPDHLVATVDEAAIESIVHNLVDNAVRYANPGGNVAVSLQACAGRLMLNVQDDGPGITPADEPHLFDRFWRGAGHDTPGSGLGLAIVQQAARRMGGTVALQNGLPRADGGSGAGFGVSLPWVSETTPPGPA